MTKASLILFLGAAALVTTEARGQTQGPLMDRDFTLDLYQGTVLGSPRILAMGGTAAAVAEGSAFVAENPAAVAMRSSTANDHWEWDWHLDTFVPAPTDDPDNNGITSDPSFGDTQTITLGALSQFGDLGFGITGTAISNERPGSGGTDIVLTSLRLKLAAGYRWQKYDVTVGGAFRVGSFGAKPKGQNDEIFTLAGTTLEAGAIWHPKGRNFRIGGAGALTVVGNDLAGDCDPLDCMGFIVPNSIKVPWKTSAGVAYRFGPTPWNTQVDTEWRDEEYVLVAADVQVTGAVANGQGLEAYVLQERQESGDSPVLSYRLGAEYEWIPGRLRVRSGAYYEPSRFDDVEGRLHVTLGLQVKVWTFCFWGDRYRLAVSVAADGARDYANSGLSIGFW